MSELTGARIAVRKTYKLYIGGAFPRSESGRSYLVTDHKGGFAANAAMASRKDARDAVAAARKAFGGWSAATAYNRGQVLYRVAELLEGRRTQFVAEVRSAEGLGPRELETLVSFGEFLKARRAARGFAHHHEHQREERQEGAAKAPAPADSASTLDARREEKA